MRSPSLKALELFHANSSDDICSDIPVEVGDAVARTYFAILPREKAKRRAGINTAELPERVKDVA